MPLAWQAGWFQCAVFDETRTADIRTEVGGVTRDETVRRTGRLVLTAPAGPGPVQLTAWYDTLAVSRRSLDGELRPDADALMGGRFTGTLAPDGRWTPGRRPFVPDRVRDVSDVGATLDDLLPRLPAFPLREDGRMTDTTGTRFERLADSLATDRRLVRLAAKSTWDRALVVATGEPGPDAREKGTREARILLDPARGLLRLDRETFTDGTMPKSSAVRGAVRASLDEHLLLIRRFDVAVDDCP